MNKNIYKLFISNFYMNLERKRILILTPTLGRYKETNGVAYTYSNLIPFFRELRDVQVDVVTYGTINSDESYGNLTVYTHKPINQIKLGNNLVTDLALVNKMNLKYPIMRRKYDLVHVVGPEFLGFLGIEVAERNKCSLICDLNTLLDDYARDIFIDAINNIGIKGERFKANSSKFVYDLAKKGMKVYFEMADLILVPTITIKNERKNQYKTPIKVVGRGIDTNKFNPKYRTRKDKLVKAVYVGRIEPEKNMELLEKVFSELKDIPLTVVGDGTYLKKMKKNLPRAKYTGKVTGKDLFESFANSDFFVFPSKTETLGNVVLQAMASGLPVIVTDKGASKELVKDKITGFITKDDEEFKEKILFLANNHKKRKEMRRNALSYIKKNFPSWKDIFYKQLIPAYESVINNKNIKKKKLNFKEIFSKFKD